MCYLQIQCTHDQNETNWVEMNAQKKNTDDQAQSCIQVVKFKTLTLETNEIQCTHGQNETNWVEMNAQKKNPQMIKLKVVYRL